MTFSLPLRNLLGPRPTPDPTLLACPNCKEVCQPVFVCLKGHSVCAVCRSAAAKCPQGDCGYPDEPVRNWYVCLILTNFGAFW